LRRKIFIITSKIVDELYSSLYAAIVYKYRNNKESFDKLYNNYALMSSYEILSINKVQDRLIELFKSDETSDVK